MGEMKWYVLRTAGTKEKKAKEYLDSRGIAMDLLSGDENFKRLGQSYIAACLPNL